MRILLLSLLILSSCLEKSEYSQEECELLSMQSYRGIPKKAHLFKKYCQSRELNYTAELCQKAFSDLLMLRDTEALKKKYGDQILECFHASTLKKY
jgi:hypothetical protein